MPGMVTVRFPDGDSSFELGETTHSVGDVLKRNGGNWFIEKITVARNGTSTVKLRPGPKSKTASRGRN